MMAEFSAIITLTAKSRRNGKKMDKEISLKVSVEMKDIKYIGEVYDDNGRLVNDRCKISVNDIGDFVVMGSYKYVKNKCKKIDIPKSIIGFRKR